METVLLFLQDQQILMASQQQTELLKMEITYLLLLDL
jgi:hypothetical protein